MIKYKRYMAVILAAMWVALLFAGCTATEKEDVKWTPAYGDPDTESKPTATLDQLVGFGTYPNTQLSKQDNIDQSIIAALDAVHIDDATGLWTEYVDEASGTRAWYNLQNGYYAYESTVDGTTSTRYFVQESGYYYLVQQMQWIILADAGDSYLLITREAVDAGRPFLDDYGSSTWADSTMRDWLNGTDDYAVGGTKYAEEWNFIDRAFTAEERAALETVTVETGDNDRYGTVGGGETTDVIWLLSADDVATYFNDETLSAKCTCTPYAARRGATLESSTRGCLWWLRTPGIDTYFQGVDRNGDVSEGGYASSDGTIGIRPVIRVAKSAVQEIDQTLPTAGPWETPTPRPTPRPSGYTVPPETGAEETPNNG